MKNNDFAKMKNFARVAQRCNYGLMNALGQKASKLAEIDRDYWRRRANRAYLDGKTWSEYLKNFPDSQFWSDETAGVMFKNYLENFKDTMGTLGNEIKTLVTG